MTDGVAGDLDRRVLIHVLTRKDADITQSLLCAEGVPSLICANLEELLAAIKDGAAAILIAEERMALAGRAALADALALVLERHAGESFWVRYEMAFRALPEYELRVADVGVVTMVRWDATDENDNLRGAPDLVVEILSPSNTFVEIGDKERLCLENGCQEFWIVDPMHRQVKVSTPDGITRTYRAGQEIPLNLFSSGTLAVDAIF
jgi:hypothetical protein